MIIGRMTDKLEACINLRILHNGIGVDLDFLVDTGFNGHIAVPRYLVTRLGLQLGAVQRGITADGRVSFFDTVSLQAIWHDQPVELHAQILDEPLIGTRLLEGNQLLANWIAESEFQLTAIQ